MKRPRRCRLGRNATGPPPLSLVWVRCALVADASDRWRREHLERPAELRPYPVELHRLEKEGARWPEGYLLFVGP
jgi:hypothetical protein